ncbi:MAG: hypothetical protein GIW97_08800, partial [Candidatus Eremiobacteraeota bacterium]|nr:hypothetical protein [Candidatus Eremiobacteraeota bacterium]
HVLCGLSAIVGIPGIRTQELTQLYGQMHHDVVGEMVRGYEIVSLREPATFNVNGLLRSAVRSKRRPNVIEAQRSFGDLCNEQHEYGRAAQVYLASGDAAKAANILKRGRASGDVSFDSFSPLPEAGEGADLLSRPELWAAVLGARRLSVHPDVLANEAVTVLESVTEATDPIFAMQVRSQSAIAFMDAGMFSAAGAILDSTKESSGTDTRSMLPILAARGVLESYLGHHDRALALWHRIRPFALYNASVFAQLTRIEVRAARQRGQWEVEYDQLQRMLHAADESRAVTIIAMALAEGVFGCWLAHESEKLDDYVAQLASLMREHELPALLNFQLASLGLQPTTRRMSNFWDAIAFLMACLREANPQRASELAETACTLADASGATYLRILARVAISEKTPSLQSEKLQESTELGNTVDSPALHESLRWIAGGSPPFGMLSAFISRFRAKGQMALEPPGIDLRIGIADATVLRAGAPISISEGGWGLLLMLSPGRPVHRDVLCDRLWPTMTLESGYNALKMCVRRTRLQLGSPDAIISTQGGYALAHWVAVDLVAMERLEDGIATGTLPETAIPQVQQYLDALRRGRPANFASWEWFSPTEQRLESIGHCFGAFLAKRAIAAADYRTAVDIADYLITLDPLDESARKLLIMAHLASGDPGAAKRELRQYSKVLRDELDAAPSAELSNLICS